MQTKGKEKEEGSKVEEVKSVRLLCLPLPNTTGLPQRVIDPVHNT